MLSFSLKNTLYYDRSDRELVQSQQYFGVVTRIIVIIVARLKKVLSTDGTIIKETFVRIEPASIFYLINMGYNGEE